MADEFESRFNTKVSETMDPFLHNNGSLRRFEPKTDRAQPMAFTVLVFSKKGKKCWNDLKKASFHKKITQHW
jgi:hypothetical protein